MTDRELLKQALEALYPLAQYAQHRDADRTAPRKKLDDDEFVTTNMRTCRRARAVHDAIAEALKEE